MEWWYATGCVESDAGTTYSYFATIWSSALGIGRVHVVDLTHGRVVVSARQVAAVTDGTDAPLDVAVGDHTYRWHPEGELGAFTFAAATSDGEIALDMTPTRAYTLHGDHGVIAQGAGGPSAYYSATRLDTVLRWTTGETTHTFTGEGWLDHQWGDFVTTPTALRWDWFACHLAGGEDLMVYRFLDLDNTPAHGRLVGTHVDGAGSARRLDDDDIRVTELEPLLARPDLGADFPVRWRLEVPSVGLDLELVAVSDQQFVDMGPPGIIFEGVAGIDGGAEGRCYVESSRLIGSS